MTHDISITYEGPGEYYLTGAQGEEYISLGEIDSEAELQAAVQEAVAAGSGDEDWGGWQTGRED
jgi:hypothetical protein